MESTIEIEVVAEESAVAVGVELNTLRWRWGRLNNCTLCVCVNHVDSTAQIGTFQVIFLSNYFKCPLKLNRQCFRIQLNTDMTVPVWAFVQSCVWMKWLHFSWRDPQSYQCLQLLHRRDGGRHCEPWELPPPSACSHRLGQSTHEGGQRHNHIPVPKSSIRILVINQCPFYVVATLVSYLSTA